MYVEAAHGVAVALFLTFSCMLEAPEAIRMCVSLIPILLLLLLRSATLQVAGPMLSGLPSGSGPSAPASSYTGGYMAALSPGAEPTLAVAFEAKGGLSDLKSTATAAVVKALLGAGSREVLPYQHKGADGPLTSVTPVVQVREGKCDMAG